MRQITILLYSFLISIPLNSQDITGDWYGNLDVQGIQLRLVFHIIQTDAGYSATMDSPDQGAKGIPITTTTFDNALLRIEATNIGATYEGNLKGDYIEGIFRQAGQEFPLILSREPIEKATLIRPQEPQPPFPYRSEEVEFQNTEFDITLAGTLTLPDKLGKHPVVVLISGSGPQDRNEELVGHKPFLVISDFLTRNGIGVLRYDDRGMGESTGDYSVATSADLTTDAESAMTYLKTRKDVDQDNIGLIGHSEGGLIAPMVAANREDVAFIVMLAGPGIRGDSILLIQQKLISKAVGATESAIDSVIETNSRIFEMVQQITDEKKLKSEISQFLEQRIDQGGKDAIPEGMSREDYVSRATNSVTNPWMLYFLRYDPAPTLEKVKCPVLAINGENDLQVTPKENLASIARALKKGGNTNVTIRELPGLNHLFQESETGSPQEYAEIEQTFSPDALNVILDWLKNQIE